MRKISYLLLITTTVVAFSACKQQDYKKSGQDGMEYKIVAEGKGDKVAIGDFVEFTVTSKLTRKNGTDSVFTNPAGPAASQIVKIDSVQIPPAILKVLMQLRKGDSLAMRTLSDSIFKLKPETMPAFIKKGDYLENNLRINNIYKTQEEADKASQAAMVKRDAADKKKAEELVATDDKTLTDYFAKNNIKAEKTPKGAYIEILQAGSGANADTANFMKINYTGKLLNGTMFDSNTDPLKGHVEPLSVNLTNDPTLGNGVIPGMSDGLRMLNKGAKAKIYIPSGLGYGVRGAGGDIPPNSNLIFEVEVLDIVGAAQAKADRDAQMKKMQAMQKKYSDSMAKVQGTAPAM